MQQIIYLLLISFGALLLLGIFHFTIYLQQRDTAFRNYAFYLLLMSLFNALRLLDERLTGIYPLPVYDIETWDPVISNMAFLMYVNFLGVILKVTKEDKLFYRCWRFIQVFVPAFLLLYLALRLSGSYLQTANRIVALASLGCMGFGMVMGLRLLVFRKEKFYQLIIAGTLVSVAGVATGLVINIFVYRDNTAFAGLYFLEISMLIEAVFLSAALGYRLKVAYREKEKVQEALLVETRNRELLAIETNRLLAKELDVKDMQSRISKDLHDDVGSSLSSLQIYCDLAARLMDEQPLEAKKMLQQIAVNTEEVMLNMGHIVWAMQPAEGNGQTMESRIKSIGYSLLTIRNINCHYKISPAAEAACNTAELRKNIVLVTKEALNNIVKYSDATAVELDFHCKPGTLHLRITDNGKGFNPTEATVGNGLKNINARMNSLGGRANVLSAPGKGTTINCEIPLASISYAAL